MMYITPDAFLPPEETLRPQEKEMAERCNRGRSVREKSLRLFSDHWDKTVSDAETGGEYLLLATREKYVDTLKIWKGCPAEPPNNATFWQLLFRGPVAEEYSGLVLVEAARHNEAGRVVASERIEISLSGGVSWHVFPAVDSIWDVEPSLNDQVKQYGTFLDKGTVLPSREAAALLVREKQA